MYWQLLPSACCTASLTSHMPDALMAAFPQNTLLLFQQHVTMQASRLKSCRGIFHLECAVLALSGQLRGVQQLHGSCTCQLFHFFSLMCWCLFGGTPTQALACSIVLIAGSGLCFMHYIDIDIYICTLTIEQIAACLYTSAAHWWPWPTLT